MCYATNRNQMQNKAESNSYKQNKIQNGQLVSFGQMNL